MACTDTEVMSVLHLPLNAVAVRLQGAGLQKGGD